MPKLHSIHQGTVVRVQDYGAFLRLGAGDKYKDGLLHISRMSASSRVDAVSDVLTQDEVVWVKVIEIKEEEGKYSLDMRYVEQKSGKDLDPNNVQVDVGGKGKGKSAPDPIRIGAVQATTCSRCGARGHAARECWSGAGGKNYDLVEEEDDAPPAPPPESKQSKKDKEEFESLAPGEDPKLVKKALKAYFKRQAVGGAESSPSSSSSSSSDKKKKNKKVKKKEKKAKKEREKGTEKGEKSEETSLSAYADICSG